MSIAIRQTSFLDSDKHAIQEINDSIGLSDPIKGKGLEAYSVTAKKVVGYIHFKKLNNSLFVDHIAVHNDYQKQGIGKMLLKEVLAIAQEKGCSPIELHSTTSEVNEFCKKCASNLGVYCQVEEGVFFQDPDKVKFFLNENVPPLRKNSPSYKNWLGF